MKGEKNREQKEREKERENETKREREKVRMRQNKREREREREETKTGKEDDMGHNNKVETDLDSSLIKKRDSRQTQNLFSAI